jgi:hypothetical protein
VRGTPRLRSLNLAEGGITYLDAGSNLGSAMGPVVAVE